MPIRLPNNLQKTSPLGGATPKHCSTDIFRQRTSWRTTTTSNKRRALPHARPITVGRTRLWLRKSRLPDTACWRVSSHERDNDRSVLRPSANHPCCTCASSSGCIARRASHGNACHASHSNKSCASHSNCGPGTARSVSSPGISSASPPDGSSTKTSWGSAADRSNGMYRRFLRPEPQLEVCPIYAKLRAP